MYRYVGSGRRPCLFGSHSRPVYPVAGTEALYTQYTQAILDRYGKKFEFATKAKMMGRSPIGAANILIADTGIPLTAEEFTDELYGTLRTVFHTVQLMPGLFHRL